MKVHIVNCSHKAKNGNSRYLVDEFLKLLYSQNLKVTYSSVMDREIPYSDILGSNFLFFSGPVYVDSLSSLSLKYLIELSKLNFKDSSLEGIIAFSNSGFYEASHNELSLEIYEVFCKKNNISYLGGLGIGAGEMLEATSEVYPLDSELKKDIWRALILIKDCMLTQKPLKENIYIVPNISKKTYLKISHSYWNKHAKKNGLDKENLLVKYKEENCGIQG
ncbi:hypothetical protein ACV3R5_14650 [Clostridium perfringens]|uniref:hypothetical protein n=1 Tax=Clostridium perfringens TaxID=1502 RepID=UPI0039EBE2BF